MEVGAVKQAYNNEVIHLKKKLNQAKIQIIHKLTRKAKAFKEKKAPEKLKEKFNHKAESWVKEVLLIKKITAKHLARFALTHEGELKKYLNRPSVDTDKACARLLLHKTLQGKYTFLRDRFSNIPIKDLFMSRQERLKLKNEIRETQKEKKKGKKIDSKENKHSDHKTISTRDDWKVEDVAVDSTLVNSPISGSLNENHVIESDSGESEEESLDGNDNKIEFDDDSNDVNTDESNSKDKVIMDCDPNTILKKPSNVDKNIRIKEVSDTKKGSNKIKNSLSVVKNKNKKVSDKFQNKRNYVVSHTIQENRIIDPFFITSSGENYMSLVEPRPPDEIKDEHKQGNRKLRRAAMFGHVPKFKRKDENALQNDRYQKNGKSSDYNKFTKSADNPNGKSSSNYKANADKPPEKLHPSWEAKKRLSSIQPFQGKKIVFD